MKVRFIQTLATARECFRAEAEYELADDEAKQFVGEGLATPVVTAEPKKAVAPTAKPKAKRPNEVDADNAA